MDNRLGLRAVELLCSRLCHDLTGPVGAVNNGLELLEEGGNGLEAEAMDLVVQSGLQAQRRLKMFRLAFGAAGREASVAPAEVRSVLEGWFAVGKVRATWTGVPDDPPPGVFKALLLAALVVDEALPGGGTLTIGPVGGRGILIQGEGPTVSLRPDVRRALDGSEAEEAATARTVVAHLITVALAASDLRLKIEDAPGRLALTITPAQA